MLAELEEQGLIARARDPRDGRRALVTLTGGGIATLTECRRQREAGWPVNSTPSARPELETLTRALPLLRQIAES